MKKESNKYPSVMKLSFCGLILSVMLILNLSGAVFSEVLTSPLVFGQPEAEPPEEGEPEEEVPPEEGEPEEEVPPEEGEPEEGEPEARPPLEERPEGSEICGDGIDNNIDGEIDEGCPLPLPPEGSDLTGLRGSPPGKIVLPPESPEAPFQARPPPGFDPNLPPDGIATPPPESDPSTEQPQTPPATVPPPGTIPPPEGVPSAEPSQTPPATVPTEQGSCNDGVDNDNDGLTDSQDEDECGFVQQPPGFDPFGP